MDAFTPEVMKALDTLRGAGFAVAVFAPDELQGVEPRYVADRMVEFGTEAIETLKEV